MKFSDLQLIEPILRAIKKEGYIEPTPIQEEAIPLLLAGKDVLASAQTGTGKTAAFAIPILQTLNKQGPSQAKKQIQTLILTPTRELATQIKESFRAYGQFLSLRTVVIFGGVSQKAQVESLQRGVDILVATPGRLLDLIGQKFINLSFVKYLILDEADRMLDMGFSKDVHKIIALVPKQRQTMLFSATMPHDIIKLANNVLIDPIRVQITPVETTLEAIKQKLYFVTKKNKTRLLIHLLNETPYPSVLVFSRTKHGANKISKELRANHIQSMEIHGNKSQGARTEALFQFKSNLVRVLVATDIAARGLDIENLALVVNYDLPEVPETYIHRIGRTGRAGLGGLAITLVSDEELHLKKAIEKHIQMQISQVKGHPYHEDFVDTGIIPPKKKPEQPNMSVKQNRPQRKRPSPHKPFSNQDRFAKKKYEYKNSDQTKR